MRRRFRPSSPFHSASPTVDSSVAPHVLTVQNQCHARGIASKRTAIPAARARSHGLRDLHARSAGTNHDLEQRSRTHQGYHAEEIIGEHFARFYTEEDQREDVPM